MFTFVESSFKKFTLEDDQYLSVSSKHKPMKNLLTLLSIIIFMISQRSTSIAQDHKTDSKEFVHTVYFWLKNPNNQAEKAKFEASLKRFITSSKYIKTKHIGVPANTNRPVINSSYTYCLSLTFTSKAEQDKYQDEDVHKVFIKESEMLWEKVLVYDSVSIL